MVPPPEFCPPPSLRSFFTVFGPLSFSIFAPPFQSLFLEKAEFLLPFFTRRTFVIQVLSPSYAVPPSSAFCPNPPQRAVGFLLDSAEGSSFFSVCLVVKELTSPFSSRCVNCKKNSPACFVSGPLVVSSWDQFSFRQSFAH